MARLLHSEAEARDALGGIGRSKLYELIAEGKIKTVKIGRRTFITQDELVRYVTTLTEAAA